MTFNPCEPHWVYEKERNQARDAEAASLRRPGGTRSEARSPQRESRAPRLQAAGGSVEARQGGGEARVNTEDVRKYAAEQGVSEEEALKKGVEEKSKEFVEKGAEVYGKA